LTDDAVAPAVEVAPDVGYLERYAVERVARNGIERAAAAGVVRMISRLVKKHPLIAAELLLSGATRAGRVGWEELGKQDRKRLRYKRGRLRSVPLIAPVKDA